MNDNDKINVILDTTVLKKDKNFRSILYKMIKKLCEYKKIKIHIPNIVEREFLSGCEIEVLNDIEQSYLTSIERKGLNKELIERGKSINKLIDEFKSDVNWSVRENFKRFITDFNVELYDLDDTHGIKVMDSYFSGMPPFERRKNRKDIPDAFVYEQIKDIYQNHNNVIFISNDNNLRKKVKENINIEVYDSLDNFIKSKEIQKHLEFINMTEHTKEFIRDMSKFEDYYKQEFLSQLENMVYKITFCDEYIPYDNNQATISGIFEIIKFKLNYKKAIGLLYDVYLPFEVKVFAEVFYPLFKPDIWKVDKRESLISINDLNDHYFEVYESLILKINGYLSITADDEIDLELMTESDQKIIIDNIKDISVQDKHNFA